MIFLFWLIAFTASEMLLSGMQMLMLILPIIFIVLGVYYLVCKNRVSGSGNMVAYEEK